MTDNNSQTPSWEHDNLVHGYFVVPGRLLATEYPGAETKERAQRKLQTLIAAGVNSFVDLTVSGEPAGGGRPMIPYKALLDGLNYERFAIPDQGVIADDEYDKILGYIQSELYDGRMVLVHCWGGKGRTGTVVGCWLIDNEGLGYPEVIDRMQELRAGTRKAHHDVPDTPAQHRVLRRRAMLNEAAK